jgi:hypothetical protein
MINKQFLKKAAFYNEIKLTVFQFFEITAIQFQNICPSNRKLLTSFIQRVFLIYFINNTQHGHIVRQGILKVPFLFLITQIVFFVHVNFLQI